MQLDRFTQKAQEAVIAAQQTAERLHSPILDAEHLLSALVEPDDGIPAETLRRLGVDLPAFRGELAAILAKRARIEAAHSRSIPAPSASSSVRRPRHGGSATSTPRPSTCCSAWPRPGARHSNCSSGMPPGGRRSSRHCRASVAVSA